MKRIYLIVWAALVANGAHTQNLISNGDFEDGDTPVCWGQAGNPYLDNWTSNAHDIETEGGQFLRYHSPDLYDDNIIFNPNSSDCGSSAIPRPTGGALSGNRSVGMSTYELIQIEIEPLISGKFYTFSSYIQTSSVFPSQIAGNCELVLSIAREEVKYENNSPDDDPETDFLEEICDPEYVNYQDGILNLSQEIFRIGTIDLNQTDFPFGDWNRGSITFRANDEWNFPSSNRAVWLIVEVRQKNYVDGANNDECFEDYIYLDDVWLEQSTFCASNCSPSLQPISYSTDPNTYNNQLPNGMAAEGFIQLPNNFYLNPFTVYVKDAMGIDLAIYDDQWQFNTPIYTQSAFDPNGLKDVGFDDYQFVWDGQLPDGSFLQEDTYFYTIRLWSCVNDLFLPDNDLQYIVANNAIIEIPDILNAGLKNCCDDFEVYNNITFPNIFRKDVNDYILAGDLGPAIVQAGSSVKFFAGNNIILGPNFFAQPGSSFTAEIQDCVYGHKALSAVGRTRLENPISTSNILNPTVNLKANVLNGTNLQYFTVDKSTIKEYSIFDLQGNLLAENSLNNQAGEIDMISIASGMYLINFEFENGSICSQKFVVAK